MAFSSVNFTIQCLVPKIGKYHLSIFVGTDGEVKSQEYEVKRSSALYLPI